MTHEPPPADVTIDEITERLSVKFPETPRETIHGIVAQVYAEFEDAHVRDFVEVLVEKQAKKRLKNLDG